MKWRLSKESFTQKEPITDKKSMSYSINDKVDTITNHNGVIIPTTTNKYKTNTKIQNDDNDDDTPHYNYVDKSHPYRRRQSIDEAYDKNDEIFMITTNQQTSIPPWEIGTKMKSSTMITTTSNIITDDHPPNTMILDNYSSETNNDFHYVNSTTNPSSTGSLNIINHNNTKNGSTSKLLPPADDQSTKQTKCSIFRGLILCLCLNITYSNIVRFPRELERYGTAFLVPYFIVLLLVGLPIILLEISIGQFLGQGSANTWRASPIFKGACVISRFASWLATIWISLDAVLAVAYIFTLIFRTVPFSECVSGVKIVDTGYKQLGKNGQECLERTFLTPVWENTFYFALLTISLILLWIIAMACTHNGKIFRRMIFLFGLIGFGLLISLTGWEIHRSLKEEYFPAILNFDKTILLNSNIWFVAIVQMIFSTNIGYGIIPVVTGKFLYKTDAIRTTIIYISFNLLINILSLIFYIKQYDIEITRNNTTIIRIYPELITHTIIYDKILLDENQDVFKTYLLSILIYSLILISSIISIIIGIYTITRLIPRHPNYILSLISLFITVITLLIPNYILSRILDTRCCGTLIIFSIVFELIGIIWIYGPKNISIDLEFSIGHTIWKIWLILWCLAPVLLTGILLWWSVDDDQYDLISIYLPRWSLLIFGLIIFLIIACLEIYKQYDYNFFGRICEATKPSKEWGPLDPLARYAWKQWRTVCHDTGRRDFTLRRRGTRDYTNSIKHGQYSMANTAKYASNSKQRWKISTPGNCSPNYSGSVFGDSAIEEDISIGKYSGIIQQHQQHQQQRYSYDKRSNKNRNHHELHKEILYVRRSSDDISNFNNNNSNCTTKIEITPTNDTTMLPIYSGNNQMEYVGTSSNVQQTIVIPKFHNSNNNRQPQNGGESPLPTKLSNDRETICWRKFSVNSEEYSTEL